MEEDVKSKLQEFFKEDEIEFRVGATNRDKTKGMALAYVTNRAIQNRLDEIFGPFGWKNEYIEWKGDSQLCGISIWDDGREQWITKWDGADNSAMEGTKGGLSDSMKRAAAQWGIGRYLYSFPVQWVALKEQGKSYVFVEKPNVPKEFLPEEGREKKEDGKITEEQKEKLTKLKSELGLENEKIKEIAKEVGVKNVKNMSKGEAKKLIDKLEEILDF